MKTFKQYIREKWEVSSYDSPRTGKRLFARNQKHIDDEHVDVNFSGNSDKDYNLEYTVNQDYYKKKPTGAEKGKKILSHVGKTINTFVRQMKPKSIGFQSSDDRRIDLHNMLARRIAKKHGGTVEVKSKDFGKELHDRWVKQCGVTPDKWIKKQ